MKKIKFNNKGFTLVELLAAMGILALIMVLTVPNILKINDSNMRQAYVDDANKLINLAKYDISKYKKNRPNGNGQCAVLGLGYLDDAEFDNPPNGGCYDVNRSYVAVKYSNHEYHYYVRLVEAYNDGGTIKYAGIGLNNVKSETGIDDLDPDAEKTTENNISKDSVIIDTGVTPNKFNYLSADPSFNVTGLTCTGDVKTIFGLQSKQYKEINSASDTEGVEEGICAMK